MRYLFFLVILRSTLADEYTIQRQVELDEGSWIDQPDTFMLPTSMCSENISATCTTMGGTKIKDRCGCVCNKQEELYYEFYKSTFGFYENQWKCFENKKVRFQADCKTILNDRQDTIHLLTLPMTKPSIAHYIPGLYSHSKCAITGGKYTKCDGNWQPLNITLVKNRFYVEEDESFNNYLYYSTSQPSTPTINGRVIRLEIECTQPKKTQCVLFKVKGRQKCPVMKSTSSPSSTWRSISTSAETHEATTIPLVTEQFNTTRERASNHGDKRGLIAGTLAGVIGLAIIVIAVIVVITRRKKRYSVRRRKDRVVENESYGLGVDTSLRFIVPGQRSQDENEYSYATNRNDGCPQLEIEAPIYNSSDDQGYAIPYRTGNKSHRESNVPVYDAPEATGYVKTNDNISKNEPEYPCEPFYNVIEVTEAGFEEPPCYQAPDELGTKMYAFPKGPETNGVTSHISHKENETQEHGFLCQDGR